MSSTREWVRGMIDRNGPDYAIEELVRVIIDDRQAANDLFASRFFERVTELDEDQEPTGRKYLRKCTEKYISSCIDLADCDDGTVHEFLYNDDDGELYPVTIGEMSRQDMAEHEIVYGSANMIANGKVVGAVVYTDH